METPIKIFSGRASRNIAHEISRFLDGVRTHSIRILGPAPAAVEKIKRTYRHQLLIKSISRLDLHTILDQLGSHLEEKKISPTTVIVDVDPVSLM